MAIPITSIVVPLDGSTLAAQALPLAGSIAERAGARLHLVRVAPGPIDAAQANRIIDDLRQAATRARVRGNPSVRVGSPADEILALAVALPHPLIVMTTHGRSGIGRWLVGSVADRVVRGGRVPVLLLRSIVPTIAEEFDIRRIMVPLDGSAYAEAALPVAETFAALFDADLRLVRVAETGHLLATFDPTLFPIPSQDITNLARDLVAEAATYLAETTQKLRSRGLRATPVNLRGYPTAKLLAQEQDAAIDLVVMATHAREGVNRIVFGSVAETLLQFGQRPLVLIHPSHA